LAFICYLKFGIWIYICDMQTIKVDSNRPDLRTISKAAYVLNLGGLLIYPTDTAYGLGANALDEKAIRKVYEVKGRDFSKPTHVVVRDWKMIEELCLVNDAAKKLYDKFLPGPLTIILPKRPNIPNLLTANLTTLGIRIPNNLITQTLSHLATFPYTTPSANKSGGKTPYSINDVKEELDISKIDLILDAGKLPSTPPSTIVDLSGKVPKILREGLILQADVEESMRITIT